MDARRLIFRTAGLLAFSVWPSMSGHSTSAQQEVIHKFERRTVPARIATFTNPSIENAQLVENEIATPQMVAWLKQMIRDNLPPTYQDDRKWNQQKEVWDGVKVWREGGHLETKRRTKLVNSGTWTKYAISIVEPEENLHIEFHRLEPQPDGKIAFSVTVDCTLDVFGRLSQWARDVQLISLSANADAACRLTLEGTVGLHLNVLRLPPDVAIKPHVSYARIDLTYYNVRRISQVGGEFAQVLGKGLRFTLDDRLDDLNGKLADKINKQLDRQSHRFAFSTQDWLKSKLSVPATGQP